MQILLRNIFFTALLLVILFFSMKCGSSPENKTYKNLASEVKYVGMEACIKCHSNIHETFIQTGMGKSFGLATKAKSSARFSPNEMIHDSYLNFSYHPFWQNDSMKIMEFRSEGNDTIFKRTETVNYIVGSGQHTNSHIFNTHGYLHQMPMTFYTQKGKWDLPPGFENGESSRFSRKIGLECMSCHNSYPDFIMGSENKFNKVPGGINCERCHGPGEIHVKEKTAGITVDVKKEIDYSIVNPAKLPVDLQFDVCQRCHLQGNTVLKEGKTFFDFRPGMKLSDVMTTFLPKYENSEDDFIMASHADRLKQSKCFIKSAESSDKNHFTCITCHNPHISVKVTDNEVFTAACKNCHGNNIKLVCSENEEARSKVQNNCVACHMQKSGAIDIPHVRITDHFIRKPVKKQDTSGIKKFIGLFAINEKNPASHVMAEAYMNQFEKFDHKLFLLDSAKKYLPDNTTSEIRTNLPLLIRLYFLKNDFSKVISYASKFHPDSLLKMLNKPSYSNADAWTCYRIGESCLDLGKPFNAFPFLKKACELAPYNMDFQNKYAGCLLSLNKKEEAENIYEKIISEDPEFAPAYCNLGFIYFLGHEFVLAEKNYDQSLSLDPDYEIALYNKVQLYITKNENKKAASILSEMIKKNPKNEKAEMILKRIKKTI